MGAIGHGRYGICEDLVHQPRFEMNDNVEECDSECSAHSSSNFYQSRKIGSSQKSKRSDFKSAEIGKKTMGGKPSFAL